MQTETFLSSSFTPSADEDPRAKLVEIMVTTLKESWGMILKVDDPFNLMRSEIELNSHWKQQSELIQRFLTGSLGERGFGNSVTEDFFDSEKVVIEFLTEELKFQSKLLSEAMVLLTDDAENARLYGVHELHRYLRGTQAAISGRLDYVFNELNRRVEDAAIAA